MKTMFLAAIAALSLSVGVAQIAQAAPNQGSRTSTQQGGYNTSSGLMGGGG
jgi:hypothetical protein